MPPPFASTDQGSDSEAESPPRIPRFPEKASSAMVDGQAAAARTPEIPRTTAPVGPSHREAPFQSLLAGPNRHESSLVPSCRRCHEPHPSTRPRLLFSSSHLPSYRCKNSPLHAHFVSVLSFQPNRSSARPHYQMSSQQ